MALIDPQRLTSAERLFLNKALILCYFTADNEENQQEYYFIALPGEHIEALNDILVRDEFALEDVIELGRIVARGIGTPNDEVKTWVEQNYSVQAQELDEEYLLEPEG